MEALIEFFITVGQLKVRPGWVLRGVKNPETFAEHAFRVFVLAWVFGQDKKLNTEKILKTVLIHSLSAVYVDYLSPYDRNLGNLLEDGVAKSALAPRLKRPASLKGRNGVAYPEEEETAIKKLVEKLSSEQKKEILELWRDFQKRGSLESKFVGAIDKLENFIQAVEYSSHIKGETLKSFMEELKEATTNEKLIDFAQDFQAYFEKKPVKNKRNKALVGYITQVGKLKKLKRVGWIYGGAKEEDTESIAGHSFRLAIMVWFLANPSINVEKMMKMAIMHDFATVYTGDVTPFDNLITHNLKKDKPTLEKWPQRSCEEKERLTLERRLKERRALDKLFVGLWMLLQDEMLALWYQYEEGFSKEGRFVRQVDRVEKLIQALEYNVKGIYKLDIAPYWVQLKQLIDEPTLKEFVEEVDIGFYGREKHPQFIDKFIQEL